MQADDEDRYTDEPKSAGLPVVPLIAAILILIAAGYWYFGREKAAEAPSPPVVAPVMPTPPIAPAEPEPEPAPDIPEPEPVAPPPEPNEPPPPPPLALDDSDPVVREQLQPAFENSALTPALQSNNLIERTAALIDLTRQGRVEPKLFPLPRPTGEFAVINEGEELYMDPAGFERYNAYAQAISALDPQLLAGTFHQFRPLLEEAWSAFGHKAEDLDNSLIRALDEVIEAPGLEHSPILVKDVTTYNYADETLEELSPLSRQLIRMGPENQALIQAQAKAIREALLTQP